MKTPYGMESETRKELIGEQMIVHRVIKTFLITATSLLVAACSAPSTRTRPVDGPRPASGTPRYESRVRQTAPASTFSGRVVEVPDGDTIRVLADDNRTHEIRLQGIDAPEGGQAFGDRSRQNLSNLIAENEVTVTWHKHDRYRRLVGEVSVNGQDICLEQIKAGMAWHYKYFQSEQTPENRAIYADAEVAARASRRGLWTDASPIPPWQFRNGR